MSHHSEHGEHEGHEHHEIPTEGRALTGVAVSATLHCLTGCAIGEITGMAIGTALGFSDFQTIALAVGLAFLFGYALTSLPLLRAGLALGAVIPIALASDTFSIAVMEIVDNAIMLVIPGAMESGLSDVLFWGALSFALAVAFLFALPVNRWLISRGKGHVAVHNTGIHGGPSPRLVGTVLVAAAIFGSTVLVAEAATSEQDEGHGGHEEAAMSTEEGADHNTEKTTMATDSDPDTVRGVTIDEGGLRVELDQPELPQGERTELSFRVIDEDGSAVTDFEVEHERQMHLIVVRRDLTGFQHLHPEMAGDGTWSTEITLPEPGAHRVFADFNRDGENLTLGQDLLVDGSADYQELSAQEAETKTLSGYEVTVEGEAAQAGLEGELGFNVTRNGEAVEVEPYLGADGHLVVLREGDLAFLHVHPAGGAGKHGGEDSGSTGGIRFMTEFPSEGRYRLFLQFKHAGEVHTAEFTREVTG
ncbi:MAG: DUF4396 domain-containing protein [Solirubrobacterales bacterium]